MLVSVFFSNGKEEMAERLESPPEAWVSLLFQVLRTLMTCCPSYGHLSVSWGPTEG